MSLSPTASSSADEIMAYDKGWAAVNRLIRAGRSFSGRERNCCFLNTGQAQFANVSSAIDLNSIDDGRGLASTDWDGDGRLDFWATNRTGPRVRFLKNEYASSYGYLALRLEGTQSNRDAIGSRVVVYLAGQQQPLIQTVHAGNGFLSQSSKTLHFGLADATQIESVVVRWPNGQEETFAGLQPNGRYRLVEGSKVAQPWPAPPVSRWQPSQAAEKPESPATRVVLLQPAPLPDQLHCQNLQGDSRTLRTSRSTNRGLLLNLWATWCPNCLIELNEWSDHADALREAGLDVLCVCTDEATDNVVADRERIATLVQRLGLPFDVALTDRQFVEILNVFQRAYIGRQSDLPLPSSFLIDAQGRLAVIYKGPVSADQVLQDVAMLGADQDQILRGSTPFDGKWLEPPPATTPRMAALTLLEHGYQQAAEDYSRQLLSTYDLAAPELAANPEKLEAAKQEFSSLNHMIGAINFDRKQYRVARTCYEAALSVLPYNRGLRRELYRTLMLTDDLEAAAEQLEVLLKDYANDPETLKELASIRLRQGQTPLAVELLKRSISLDPGPPLRFEMANMLRNAKQYAEAEQQYRAVMEEVSSPAVVNNLAWLLATAADAQVRNGTTAVDLAEQACDATSRQVPRMLGTLAAAHAECGDFDRAQEVILEAIELARSKETALVPELTQRLHDYQNRRATRE